METGPRKAAHAATARSTSDSGERSRNVGSGRGPSRGFSARLRAILTLPPPPLPLGRARILLALWCLATLTVSSYPHLQPPGPFAARDKLAHLVEYAILGHLLGRVAWESAGARSGRRFLVALAAGLAFGGLDELWQGMVPGRTTSGWDLFADTLGVALGLFTAWRAVAPAVLTGAAVRRGAPAGAPQME